MIIKVDFGDNFSHCPFYSTEYGCCNVIYLDCNFGFPPEDCPLNKGEVRVIKKEKENKDEN